MRYFYYEEDSKTAEKIWNQSQFELGDIVLSLTDQGINTGEKIYAVFCRDEVLAITKYFICDFSKIKTYLGINGNYIERRGDIYSKTFNPRRNPKVLTLSADEMKTRADEIYKYIMKDLNLIAKMLSTN